MIGVFHGNFGGDIEFLLGIKMEKFMLGIMLLKRMDGYKIVMFLIHGFLVLYGLFLLSAFQIIQMI